MLMHVDMFTVQSSVITLPLQVTDRPLLPSGHAPCLTVTKISQKDLGGYFFDSHCRTKSSSCMHIVNVFVSMTTERVCIYYKY